MAYSGSSISLLSKNTLSCTVVEWDIVNKPFPLLRIVWPAEQIYSPARSYYELTWKESSMWVNGKNDRYQYFSLVARPKQYCKWRIVDNKFMVMLLTQVKGKPVPVKVWVVFDRWVSSKFVEVK